MRIFRAPRQHAPKEGLTKHTISPHAAPRIGYLTPICYF
jgi:hypothetical protein